MRRLLDFWHSTIGKKVVMAVSGVVLISFVILHMAGNLQMFAGADAMREYAELLRTIPELLWLARAGLFVALVAHVVSAVQISRRNAGARGVKYAKHEPQASTFAGRWMRLGGIFILFFVVVHLGHFTTGWFNEGMVHMQPYGNVVMFFEHSPLRVAFYVVAMMILGLHLYHGAWASVRTLGLRKTGPESLKHGVSRWVAILVWAGFTIVPVAVALGILN